MARWGWWERRAGACGAWRWRVGQIKLPPTTMVRANMPGGNDYARLQGLLGSDMLSRFDVVTIDYAHEQLRLHPRK